MQGNHKGGRSPPPPLPPPPCVADIFTASVNGMIPAARSPPAANPIKHMLASNSLALKAEHVSGGGSELHSHWLPRYHSSAISGRIEPLAVQRVTFWPAAAIDDAVRITAELTYGVINSCSLLRWEA